MVKPLRLGLVRLTEMVRLGTVRVDTVLSSFRLDLQTSRPVSLPFYRYDPRLQDPDWVSPEKLSTFFYQEGTLN